MNYECLVSFLNCPITLFYFDLIYSKLDNTGWQWKKEPMEKIPVPKFDKNTKHKILKLQMELEKTKEKANRNLIVAKISMEIYKWYNLSKEDIKAIYDRTIVFNDEFKIIEQFI